MLGFARQEQNTDAHTLVPGRSLEQRNKNS